MKLTAFLALLAVAGVACSSAAPVATPSARPSAWPAQAQRPLPALADAIRSAVDLGVAGPATTVSLNFNLTRREPADPALIPAAVAYAEHGGLASRWHTGSSLIAADGPAPAVDALLGVQIDNYRLPDGSTFYATTRSPRLPGPIAAVAAGVTGLDDYGRSVNFAVKPGGLKPVDVMNFYNIKPLRDRGLDGSGETILFPELEVMPQQSLNDLDKFAREFNLPPFSGVLTIKTDKSWGTPEKPVGEAVLDLEIAHEIAPKAKLVAYLAGPQFTFLDRAFDQLVSDHLGSIISESLGACEPGAASAGSRRLRLKLSETVVAAPAGPRSTADLTASASAGRGRCAWAGQDEGAAAGAATGALELQATPATATKATNAASFTVA